LKSFQRPLKRKDLKIHVSGVNKIVNNFPEIVEFWGNKKFGKGLKE
jgi:hypothetical protein